MVASCSRVICPSGSKPEPVPVTMPFPLAQATASAYQAAASTSGKAASALAAGVSSRRWSTVTSMARVMGAAGANWSSLIPLKSSRAVTKAMASLPQ